MMISPQSYIKQFENASYIDFIKERDRLVSYLRNYELSEITGHRTGKDWAKNPSPGVRYQCYFWYLSALCEVMQKRYNKEYVWGNRSLATDCTQETKEYLERSIHE